MSDYRGLILDFGGVLTTSMRANGVGFERESGLEPGAYFAALTEHPDGVHVYAELEVGRATQEDWNRVIGGILGLDPTDLMRRALARLRPEPRIVELVGRARREGVVTAMLSNSFGLTPFNVYKELGMWEGFTDVVVLSEEEGVRKPSPEIYRRTVERMGLAPEECVFVDDHERNLPPAEAMGITCVHATDATLTEARVRELLNW
ncbi:HAD family hydrolase [Streptomyces alkaliphilus]|nr:HAD family phosphatase [Streptomyces alkaliphilus]